MTPIHYMHTLLHTHILVGPDKLNSQFVANRQTQTSGGQVLISTMRGPNIAAIDNCGRHCDWLPRATEPSGGVPAEEWRQPGLQFDPTLHLNP